MLRRNQRLRREYIYRKSLEGKERVHYENKRKIREALREGKPIPTELRNEEAELRRKIDLEDENTAVPRSHIDDEYAFAAEKDPKILLTTSRDPSAPLKQFVKELSIVFPNAERMNRGGQIIVPLLDIDCKDSMGTEFETIEGRITSMLLQLQCECGIVERLVYKNKNQHRRCSYFQHLMKVRKDLRLLQLANLEELVRSCFSVIKEDRPKQKIHLLESLKRRKCNDEKRNFLDRLLGSARLLEEMVEPMLKAATEISVLFARSFFMGLSVTIMALLARLRVLVQQILLDIVDLFNMVSSLSKKKQSIKITHEGIEVFREFYPASDDDDYVALECVWKSDKYILHERKHKKENESQGEDSGGNLSVQASGVNYDTIQSILGDDQHDSETGEADAAAKEDPPHVKDTNTDLLTIPSQIDDFMETVFGREEGGENLSTTKASFRESSPEGDLHVLSQSSTGSKPHSGSKKVAFLSIKNPTLVPQSVQSSISMLTSNAKMGNESDQTKDDKGDSLASILTGVKAKDSLF